VISGGNAGGLYAYNTAGLKLDNINFVGSGATTNTESGVFFYMDLPNNVLLDTITVNNVDVSGFGDSGLLVGSWNGLSGYKNVHITNVAAHNNGNNGMSMYGYTNSSGYTLQNVYIGHSAAYNNLGNASSPTNTGSGIAIGDANGLVIEYCLAHDNGINNTSSAGPVGIWAYESNNVTFQYNESYKNRTSGGDGSGFDLDGGVTNSVMQYNYSHDNDGSGFQLVEYSGARPHSGNTIRYNVSENDSRKNYGSLMLWNSGSGIANAEIYNNTVYLTPAPSGQPSAVLLMSATTNIHFRNNILVTTGGLYLTHVASGQSGVSFDHNDYWASGSPFNFQWGNAAHDPNELQLNPLLTSPGTGGTIGDTSQLATLTEYKLMGGSPAIEAGFDLTTAGINPGLRDFYGSTIPQGPEFDIGAHESTAGVSVPAISSFVANPSSIGPGSSSTLSWSVSGATSLSISPTVGVVTGLTQKVVTPSATTTYVLTATNSAGSATASATVTVTTTPDTTPPTTPTGLAGSVLSSSSVHLSWNASTDNIGVAGYKVYRNGGLRTSLNALTYQDSGLTANTTYSYNVAAYDAAGNTSGLSSPISLTTAPAPPVISSFVANPISIASGSSSTLSWSVTGATSLSISPTVGTVTGLTQKVVTPSATTTYVLTATNSGGSITASATVTVTGTQDTTPPTIPTGLTGTVLSSSSVKVSWNASTDNVGVTGYKVFRNGTLRTTLNALTYQDSGLTASTTYSYTVSAYDAAGNTSGLSTAISLTTAPAPPVIGSFVANPTSIASGSSSTLSWSVSGPTSLSISPTVGTVTGLTQKAVTPSATTTYVLTATNSGGSTTASATVTVATTQDTTPPTTPTGLTGTVLSSSSVKLSWNASTDNVGVAGYKVFRNGVLITSINALTYQNTGLSAGTTYSYKVAAYDAAGNTSAQSAAISLTTPLVQGPWTGGYYTLTSAKRMGTLIFTRTDSVINFNWGLGAPGPGAPVDEFFVQWTASLPVPQSRVYNFTVTSNDGVRMWIDGVQVLNSWTSQSATFTFSSSLTAGTHSFQVEYYDFSGSANISVAWK